MSRFFLKPLAFTCIVLFAVACATPRVSQQPTVGDVKPCLQLSLNVPQENQKMHATNLALELINTCDHALSFFLNTEPAYDVQISSPKNEFIWSLRSEIDLADVIRTQELEAGQTQVFAVSWDQVDREYTPVAAGDYLAVGTIDIVTNDDSQLTLKTEPITFSIDPTL